MGGERKMRGVRVGEGGRVDLKEEGPGFWLEFHVGRPSELRSRAGGPQAQQSRWIPGFLWVGVQLHR